MKDLVNISEVMKNPNALYHFYRTDVTDVSYSFDVVLGPKKIIQFLENIREYSVVNDPQEAWHLEIGRWRKDKEYPNGLRYIVATLFEWDGIKLKESS